MKNFWIPSQGIRISAAVRTGFVLLFSAANLGQAANQPNEILWESIDEHSVAPAAKRLITPRAYRMLRLDTVALARALAKAPMEFTREAKENPVIIHLPKPDGTFVRFRIEESPMLSPEIAAQVPDWKTYSGCGVDDPTVVVRFSWSASGLRAAILERDGYYYIDPYSANDHANYIAYFKRDLRSERGDFHCALDKYLANKGQSPAKAAGIGATTTPQFSNGTNLKTYRLAIATTGEYTVDRGGQAAALNDVMNAVNRINLIYRRDVSVSFTLVSGANTIFADPATDPYNNTDDPGQLSVNQTTLDNVIGNPNYDIGHLFGTGGGGIALTPSVCSAGEKAHGYSARVPPTGDPFWVDYVAHEIGHQLSGQHTYNTLESGTCSTRSDQDAYEVASGATIMSYVGICGDRNTQENSFDDFHVRSLTQIISELSRPFGGGSCGTTTATSNNIPNVNPGTNFTIPKETPFTLTATATDADGDAITYSWEEYDLAASASGPNGTPAGTYDVDTDGVLRPLFRVFAPSANPARTFPSLPYILNNANNPPLTFTGASPTGAVCEQGLTCVIGESLPTVTRTMNFRVVARDNRGGTSDAGMQVIVRGNSGPFAITSPNTAITVPALSNLDVTWNVAGTAASPINTADVKISLSVDGGFTFPLILAASTPNDGAQSVIIPNTPTTTARIKVEAVENIFFDVSDKDFTITPAGNGKIAFVRLEGEDANRWQIYTMEADGSHQIRLTSNSDFDDHPAWSPDGSKIAFASTRDGDEDIYVMDADGSNPVRLTDNPEADFQPTWSPDGTKIAFVSTHNGGYEIYVMDSNGSNPVNLTRSPTITDGDPAWSPDGRKIAFISEYPVGTGGFAIHVMDADGSNKVRLTNKYDLHPTWSPDGTKIAFSRTPEGDVYAMDADGSNQINLTNNPAGNNQHPVWSPDGTKIAFISNRDGPGGDFDGFEIYVMDADGSNQIRLTNNREGDFYPSWQQTAATSTPTPTPGSITPPGSNVVVQSPSGDESVAFAQVTTGGLTTFTPIDPASVGQLPTGYQLSAESRAFDITTTATVVLPIDVSFHFPFIINPAVFARLRILHGESGSLVDRTLQHDFATKMIRARVNSLSPFVVAQSTASPNRLLNISTRLRVETGDNVLIGGFIITGNDPKRVIIRCIGPSLSGFGVPDALQNPTLQLYQGDTLLAENDNWKDTQQVEIEDTGIPPTNELESAIVRTLSPGAYTAILRDKDNGTGVGLVEAYDLSAGADAKLANISTRGFVATGDNVLIGGFIIGSTSHTPAAVVVRAIGPSLSGLGVPGALQNPRLDLYNSSGTVVAANDNWGETQQVEIGASGIAPSDDRESAIAATLASGAYTAIVSGAGNTTGVAVVEVYNVQ